MPRPTGLLGVEAGRAYMLALVNADRRANGLEPVELDEVATRAGQRHADDMASKGFTAHWGSDGSVPEQRYTEAGGVHLVWENAFCISDGTVRELERDPQFSAEDIERIEHAFMSEVPPNDGHRKNILMPKHARLGIGLAKPRGIPTSCLAHEFVDVHGDYEALPMSARAGARVAVAGSVETPAEFGAVGIAHGLLPVALSATELGATSTYAMPTPYALFLPPGFVTPRPVRLDGDRFSIDLVLDRGPGRYAVSVWGRFPGEGKALSMVSLRTVLVR